MINVCITKSSVINGMKGQIADLMYIKFDQGFLRRCGFAVKDAFSAELTSDNCIILSYLGKVESLTRDEPIARLNHNKLAFSFKRIPQLRNFDFATQSPKFEAQIIDNKLVIDLSRIYAAKKGFAVASEPELIVKENLFDNVKPGFRIA